MKVFITGGTGFIGQHVVKQLVKDKHTLLLLCPENEELPHSLKTSKTLKILKNDLSNIDIWKKEVGHFKPHASIHMAWEGIPNYNYKNSMRNLVYGLNLITMLAEIGCKCVLCTGSCWEYGQKSGKLNEDLEVKPSNAFTAAKNSLHMVGREIAKENNMKFIWTRLFYVYGPGQKSHSLIPNIINAIESGNTPDIKTPHSRNDFVYVEDVANAIYMLITKQPKGEIYNIGLGHSTEVAEIINMVYSCYGLNKKYDSLNEISADLVQTDFWADISRIKNDVGWEPKFNVEKGIEKTIEYFKKIN